MGIEALPWVITSGWASGINAYAVVLIMGVAERFFSLAEVPDALGRTDVLIVAGILFVLEMFADKIPYVDSAWDTVHTVIRPLVGATLGYLIGNSSADLNTALLAATGGISALLSHLVKAGIRTGVNASPEPVSNVVVSTTEDVAVAGVVTLAFLNPWLAAALALSFLVAGVALVVFLLKRVRRLKKRYDDRGQDATLAPQISEPQISEPQISGPRTSDPPTLERRRDPEIGEDLQRRG